MANKNFEVKHGLSVGGTERITAAGAGSLTNLTLSGNLTVNGSTVTLDAATLQVEDKNITLNYHASNDTSSSADGAGITIQDAVDASTNATINWNASADKFVFSHPINSASYIEATGNISTGADAGRLRAGGSNEMQIYFDGSHGHLNSSTGNFTLDVAGDIVLDAGGQNWYFDDDGTRVFSIAQVGSEVYLQTEQPDKNMIFRVNDGGSVITAMTIDAADAGRVGVGTGSPGSKLHVKGTASNTINTANAFAGFDGSGGDGIIIGARASSPFEAYIQSGYLPNIGTSHHYPLLLNPHGGNVGINMTAPTHALDVTGTIRAYASGSGNAWLYTQNDNKVYLTGVRGSSSNAYSIYDLTADKSRFRVNSDGGIAIGENNVGYAGQILSVKAGTGNNVLYGESSDANCIVSLRDNGSSVNIGYGCISNAHVFFQDGTEVARISTGSADKYPTSGNGGIGGSGSNLHLHGDDSEIRMANQIIHSDNSGNTKFTIRNAYGHHSALAELSLDGGFVTMNVGSQYTEMLKATTSNVTIGRTNANGYYLRNVTQYGFGQEGSQNGTYYHHDTDRSINYWGKRCEASGGFHTYSDENLKKEITTLTGALDDVSKMNGVTFKWKDPENRGGGDTGKQFGVIAQNMLTVDSELPQLNDDPLETQENLDDADKDTSYYTMDYTRLTPYFIEAIKELKAKNEALEARIATLEG